MYWATSEGIWGRGPTIDISPRSTFSSWGNSSSELRRTNLPTRVMRGSSRILKAAPSASFRMMLSMITLRTMVGLDPTHADAWLALAGHTRWFGDYVQAEDALAGCRAALPHHASRRDELAGTAALCESWLRYDRGEWKRGLAMADSAAAYDADDDEVQLLRALHLAGTGRNWELIVADEPLSSLDLSLQYRMVRLIRDLGERTGIAFLVISHDLSVVRRLADRVAVMYAGQIVERADRETVLARPCHPYTRGLLRSMPARSAAAMARSQSARVRARGFSQKTCLPASTAAWRCLARKPGGQHKSTISMSVSRSCL